MSLNLTIQEILEATDGVLLQGKMSARAGNVSIDSRTFKKGELFVAITGTNFDGHDFIKAVAPKASAVMVSKPDVALPGNKPVIYVKDTVKALGQIALAHRKTFHIPVVAITGSSGKTTTKDMVAAVLSKKYNVLYNVGTQNNHIGVPLTLLKLNRRHKAAVLELGTNRFGDIAWLARLAYPTMAIFTTVGESHLECLKSPQGVLEEKINLVRFMDPRGPVVVNQDNVYLAKIKRLFSTRKIITFGIKNKADFQALGIELNNNQSLDFCLNGKHCFELNTPVMENVYNALAAIVCGRLLKVDYAAAAKALKQCHFPDGRQRVAKINQYWLIDDTYNANPVSFRSAVNTLSHLQVSGRKILVCADMLELGKKSRQLHRSAGEVVAHSDVDVVLTFGRWAKQISDKVRHDSKGQNAQHFKSLDILHRKLKGLCREGDAVLVKGSRGMHMERTVEYLTENIFSKN